MQKRARNVYLLIILRDLADGVFGEVGSLVLAHGLQGLLLSSSLPLLGDTEAILEGVSKLIVERNVGVGEVSQVDVAASTSDESHEGDQEVGPDRDHCCLRLSCFALL
jgi:hypothetical protein